MFFFFFFNDTATTEIYTLSLHDALPILQLSLRRQRLRAQARPAAGHAPRDQEPEQLQEHAAGHRLRDPLADRKSTRLNSSHSQISYAVFCLKKKKKTQRKQNKTRQD